MIARRVASATARLLGAARHYRTSPLEVTARYLWLRARRGIPLGEALTMGLLDPGLPADRAATYVTSDELLRTLRALNPNPTDAVDDKALLYAACRSQGLPCPRTFATVTPPFGVAGGRVLRHAAEWERFLREELPAAFVVKPARGLQGRLVDVFLREGERFRSGGRRFTAEGLHRRLCAEGAYGRAIVQERLTNHASLAELSGTAALQCTRIVTVVDRDGRVAIPYACQKLIAGTNDTDNFSEGLTGNLVANLAVETGVLGCTFGRGRGGLGHATHETHPATHRRIPGFRLPHWSEACALVRGAALHVLPLRAIGWDVALTPGGPVIVEGNTLWFCLPREGFWHREEELAPLRAAL